MVTYSFSWKKKSRANLIRRLSEEATLDLNLDSLAHWVWKPRLHTAWRRRREGMLGPEPGFLLIKAMDSTFLVFSLHKWNQLKKNLFVFVFIFVVKAGTEKPTCVGKCVVLIQGCLNWVVINTVVMDSYGAMRQGKASWGALCVPRSQHSFHPLIRVRKWF